MAAAHTLQCRSHYCKMTADSAQLTLTVSRLEISVPRFNLKKKLFIIISSTAGIFPNYGSGKLPLILASTYAS